MQFGVGLFQEAGNHVCALRAARLLQYRQAEDFVGVGAAAVPVHGVALPAAGRCLTARAVGRRGIHARNLAALPRA